MLESLEEIGFEEIKSYEPLENEKFQREKLASVTYMANLNDTQFVFGFIQEKKKKNLKLLELNNKTFTPISNLKKENASSFDPN